MRCLNMSTGFHAFAGEGGEDPRYRKHRVRGALPGAGIRRDQPPPPLAAGNQEKVGKLLVNIATGGQHGKPAKG